MSDKAGLGLIENQSFQDLLTKMDDDADEAEKPWKSQVGNSFLVDFPSGYLKQYKADGTQLLNTRRAFNEAWIKIVGGRGEPKKLLSAYDEYSSSLVLLQESNARSKALLEAAGANIAKWAAIIGKFAKVGRALKLERELDELENELRKAIREVSDVKLKRALNVALSAITLMAVPEAALAKVAVAAAGITGHMILDNVFGQGSTRNTVVFVVGDGAAAIEKLGEAGAKLVGALGAVLTFKFDSEEVGEAEEIVDRLQRKIASTLKEYKDFMDDVIPFERQLQLLDAMIGACAQEVNRALTRSSDAAMNYDAIKNSIKKALRP